MIINKANSTIKPPWVATKAGPRKLYLAYGANLHIAAMRQRCPDATVVRDKQGQPAKYMLQDARLVFRGCADLDYCPGAEAPIGLWWISDRDEAALDRFEGHFNKDNPDNYYQKFHIKFDPNRPDRQGMIYLMTDRDGIFPPSAYYVVTLRNGYNNFGLDESYLDAAVAHAFTDKNPSPQTIARRARQKKHSQHYRLARMPESVAIARMEAERDAAEAKRGLARRA